MVVRTLPSPESFILTFPHDLFGAVSQRYRRCCLPTAVLMLPPIRLNLQLSRCTSFLADMCMCICVCVFIHTYIIEYIYIMEYIVYITIWASLVALMVKNLSAMWETWVQTLVRKIPWRRECLPTLVFLPGELHGQSSQWVIVHWVSKSWTRLRD